MAGEIQYSILVIYEIFLAIALNGFLFLNDSDYISIKKVSFVSKRTYLILALAPLALMCMFHSYKIGNDSKVYYNLYNSMKYISFRLAISNGRYEKGYMTFLWIIAHLFRNPQWIFILTGFFFFLSLGVFLDRYANLLDCLFCYVLRCLYLMVG